MTLEPPYPLEEIARRANEIYERDLRARLEPGNTGKILVIDIESGDWEMGDNGMHVTDTLMERRPKGEFFRIRIGYPSVGRMGGRWGKKQ